MHSGLPFPLVDRKTKHVPIIPIVGQSGRSAGLDKRAWLQLLPLLPSTDICLDRSHHLSCSLNFHICKIGTVTKLTQGSREMMYVSAFLRQAIMCTNISFAYLSFSLCLLFSLSCLRPVFIYFLFPRLIPEARDFQTFPPKCP